MTRGARCLLAVIVALLVATSARAGSLAGDFSRFIQRHTQAQPGQTVADFVTPTIQRIALRGLDFPTTSTTPGFTYRFDFALGSFQREPVVTGPVFVERPETIGKGHLDVGLSFLWADSDRIDGGSFGLIAGDLSINPFGGGPPLDLVTLSLDDFSLKSFITGLSATYGITDWWDVNALLPVIETTLGARGVSFRSGTPPRAVSFDNSAFGVGDLLLRTKIRLLDGPLAQLASGLDLRCPTGTSEDFHGLGDVVVRPFLTVGRAVGSHHLHVSVAIDANADDLERSRVRYAGGASLQVIKGLSLLLDFVGSSAFTRDVFTLHSNSPVILPPETGVDIIAVSTTTAGNTVTAAIPRDDVVDLSAALKLSIADRVVGYAGAIVPLTTAGLQPGVAIAWGVEYTF